PRVDLHIREATHDQLEGRIESGEVDVAFVYDTLVPGHPRRERLFALPAHVLLAADDPLAQAETVRLEDVAPRDLILLDAPPSSAHTLSLFEARGLTPRIRHRTASYEAVRTLVGRGLGYGILVQRPANPASYEGYPVAMKEISPPVDPVGIDVIWSATIDPPDRVRALISFARSISWTSA
ncbi:LysR substrate-binding domain-containing protein, partial [Microbacterium sp. 5K110]